MKLLSLHYGIITMIGGGGAIAYLTTKGICIPGGYNGKDPTKSHIVPFESFNCSNLLTS